MDLQGRNPSLSHTEKEKEEKEGGDAGVEQAHWYRPGEAPGRIDMAELVETWPFPPWLQTEQELSGDDEPRRRMAGAFELFK